MKTKFREFFSPLFSRFFISKVVKLKGKLECKQSFTIFFGFFRIFFSFFCSEIDNLIFQPADKKKFPYGGMNSSRPVTPPRGSNQKKGKKQILREEILLLHHHHYYQHHHKLSLCCLSIFTMTKTPVLLSCTENTKNFTNFYWTEKSLDNFTIFFSKIFF